MNLVYDTLGRSKIPALLHFLGMSAITHQVFFHLYFCYETTHTFVFQKGPSEGVFTWRAMGRLFLAGWMGTDVGSLRKTAAELIALGIDIMDCYRSRRYG